MKTITCKTCQKDFSSSRSDKLYCSRKCGEKSEEGEEMKFNCNICGLTELPWQHKGAFDCVQFLREVNHSLYQKITELKGELPPGECFLRAPLRISKEGSVDGRLWIEGRPTLKEWQRFQKQLVLMDSIFEEDESGNSVPTNTIGQTDSTENELTEV